MTAAPAASGAEHYRGRRVLVGGAGVAGAAAARVLLDLDARVCVLDRADSVVLESLRAAGARIVVATTPPVEAIDWADEVVVSPGFAPHSALAMAAHAAGRPTCSEPELAWRLRPIDAPPWLAVTGTNGKTTTTTMLAAMLRAGGARTAALGNIGEPLVFAARAAADHDVLAVELSSQQLHWSSTLAPQAGALLNLDDDHLEWHGSFAAYAEAKVAIWRAAAAGDGIAIGNADDPRVSALLDAGPASSGPGRRISVTTGRPRAGQLGVVDGALVDWAFVDDPVELAQVSVVRPAGDHNVSNALHAAALARAYGTAPEAIALGLADYEPQPHRNALVDTVDGVRYIDDSKATNPHAAFASLAGCPRVVWVAGGQLKGVDIAPLVASVADRLVGAVLLGIDRAQIAVALARHAPGVPVVEVTRTDDDAMAEVVRAAATLAHAGDTVLLAPAAASRDMYVDYAQRGDAFAYAVRAMTGPRHARELPR